jgi:hypothetical protein
MEGNFLGPDGSTGPREQWMDRLVDRKLRFFPKAFRRGMD